MAVRQAIGNVVERMVRAVEKVRARLLRAADALDAAGVPYAIIGGQAVAAWVATVEEAAVRNTRDVDVLLERHDLARARQALERAGFVHRHSAGMELFLDGPGASARDAVHITCAGEKVRPESVGGLRVIGLDALVRMKLTSFRRKDQVHLLDLIEMGLVGEGDLAKLPPALAARLRELLENPDT